MRFVIVLAFLCCCSAAEQTTSATQQEDRQPPQHVKDFVEQHIKHAKQQLPVVQQQHQPTEGTFNVESEKTENIKESTENPITNILKSVAQQQQKTQSESRQNAGLPTLISQRIETLKGRVKAIIKHIETHIPQVIAFKKKLQQQQQQQQQNTEDELNLEERAEPHVATKEVINKPVVQTLAEENVPETSQVNKKREVQKPVVPEHSKSAVEQIHKPVAQAANQSINQSQKQVDEKNSVAKGKVQDQHDDQVQNKDATISSDKVQSIADSVHPLVPQVVQQHAAAIEKDAKDQPPVAAKGQEIVEQVPQAYTEHIIVAVPGVAERTHPDVVERTHQLVEPVTEQKSTLKQNKDIEEHQILSGNVQGIIEQNHQHLPQTLTHQHIDATDKDSNQETPQVPQHGQGIVEQNHQQVPQLINQDIDKVQTNNAKENLPVPDNAQGIVQQIQEPIPQLIKQDADVIQNKVVEETPSLPANILGIIQQIHQHVPQVVSQQISQTQEQDVPENAIVPSNKKVIGQQIHPPIPPVIHDAEENVAQEHTNIPIANQPVDHTIDAQVVKSDLQSILFLNQANVHPAVQIAEKLTQQQVYETDNIVPSRVQQIQNEYHASPVRTT